MVRDGAIQYERGNVPQSRNNDMGCQHGDRRHVELLRRWCTGNEEYSPPAFVLDDFSGHYGGGLHQTAIGCSNPAFSGTTESIGVLNITQNGAAITLQSFPTTGGSCSFPSTLTQAGQMGAVSGSYARICVA